MIDTALKWHGLGIAPIPIYYKSKRPMVKWTQYQSILPTIDEIKKWFSFSFRNMAIVTGWQNLVVIDFDDMGMYKMWCALYKNLIDSYTIKSNRGMHVYFYIIERVEHTIKLPMIDIKASGYVLVPPSIHPSGVTYTRHIDCQILTLDSLRDCIPSFLLDRAIEKPVIEIKERSIWEIACSESGGISVEAVKQRVRIESFFPNAVATGNHWFMDFCPLHTDSTRSFWINTNRQICGCHSCINGSMDVIDLYCRMNSVNVKDAIKELIRL